MQPRPYKFNLIGKWDNAPDELLEMEDMPDGWKDYSVKWILNDVYLGFGRKASFSMKFFKKGASFLRKYYDTFGINARVILKVYKGNMATYQYDFESEFDIDFSQFKSYQYYVEVGFRERGVAQMLQAFDKSTYDIPMSDGEIVFVENGINIIENAIYDRIYTSIRPSHGYILMNLKKDLSKIETINYIFQDSKYTTQAPIEILPFCEMKNFPPQTTPDIVKFNTSISYILNFFITISGNDLPIINDYVKVELYLIQKFEKSGTKEYKIDEKNFTSNDLAPGNGNVQEIAFKKITLDIEKRNSTLFLELRHSNGWSGSMYHIDEVSITDGDCSFEYYGDVYTNPFHFTAYQLYEWAEKIFQKMGQDNSETYNFIYNSFLQQYKDRIMVTSADAIRGLPDAIGKGCFRDFYDAISSIIGCGVVIEDNNAYFFPKELILNSGVEIADLGSVRNLTVEPFTDWIHNRFKFGYPNKDYDKLNGRHEFNTTIEFTSPAQMSNVEKAGGSELNMVGKYRADSFGIQWLKYEYSNKKTADSRSDNDMFFIAVKKVDDNLVVEQAIQYNSIENEIGQKGLFNFFLSPKRNMMRNASLLAAITDKIAGQKDIRFASSEKVDSNLESQLFFEDKAVIENENINIGNSFYYTDDNSNIKSIRLFRPMFFKFEAAAQFSAPQHMKYPLGFVRFNYFGLELKGFVYDVTEATTPKKAQDFILLAHPDTPDDVCQQIEKAGH